MKRETPPALSPDHRDGCFREHGRGLARPPDRQETQAPVLPPAPGPLGGLSGVGCNLGDRSIFACRRLPGIHRRLRASAVTPTGMTSWWSGRCRAPPIGQLKLAFSFALSLTPPLRTGTHTPMGFWRGLGCVLGRHKRAGTAKTGGEWSPVIRLMLDSDDCISHNTVPPETTTQAQHTCTRR